MTKYRNKRYGYKRLTRDVVKEGRLSGLRRHAIAPHVDVAQVQTMFKGFQLFHIFYKFPKLSGQISGFSKV